MSDGGLRQWHMACCRDLGSALSQFLHASIEVRPVDFQRGRYSDLVGKLESVGCCAAVRLEPGEASLLLDIGLGIVFPLIDRMLGGRGEAAVVPQRPLTEIERRLVARLASVVLNELVRSWDAGSQWRPIVETVESDPGRIRALSLPQAVARLRWEVTMGGQRGTMTLYVPNAVLAAVGSRIAPNRRGDDVGEPNPDMVEVAAALGGVTLRAEDLADLQVGDVIGTEQRIDAEVAVEVDGEPKFLGRAGALHGRKAVQISRADDGSEKRSD